VPRPPHWGGYRLWPVGRTVDRGLSACMTGRSGPDRSVPAGEDGFRLARGEATRLFP
jgi:hypothetical protein